MIDWNKIKFRASSWGNLLAEPQSKADKDAGKLGKTCQAELIKIYNQEVYGRRKEIITAAMEKGKLVEKESIAMYSMLEGKLFWKNDERLENDFFTGHPDVFYGESIREAEIVDDMKNSWEMDSFMPWLVFEPDRDVICQLNVYYDLTGAKCGHMVRTLMDCPPEVLEGEKYKLLRSMNVISEESHEYKRAVEELVENLTFSHNIPPEERCIKIPIPRDEELIDRMKQKVPRLREWLSEFHRKHKSLYKTETV